MNRFQPKRNYIQVIRKAVLPITGIVLMLGLFYYSLSSVSEVTTEEQKKSLEDALTRCIVHCYSVDGAYPESLSYLEKHYTIHYDKEKFFVDYQPIGKNIMPDVTVVPLEGGPR